MSSRVIRVTAGVRTTFLFRAEYYSIVWILHTLLLRSFVPGHLACFHHLAVVNSASVHVGVQISARDPAFGSFEYMPSSGVAGLNVTGNFVSFFEDAPY